MNINYIKLWSVGRLAERQTLVSVHLTDEELKGFFFVVCLFLSSFLSFFLNASMPCAKTTAIFKNITLVDVKLMNINYVKRWSVGRKADVGKCALDG